jgi:hypothetical protein
MVMLGLAATGCGRPTLARMLYPEAAELTGDAVERSLQAFVLTVVPGAEQPGRIIRAFADPALKLAPYRRILVADLDRRAHSSGSPSFEQQSAEQRTGTIQDGLASGGIAGKLYNGAVFLTQVVYYSGLWNSAAACPSIGFNGPYRGDDGPVGYPEPETFLPPALTRDGNPE